MLIEEIEAFCRGVEVAQSNGLLYEFVDAFFSDDSDTPFEHKVVDALYEWDMI